MVRSVILLNVLYALHITFYCITVHLIAFQVLFRLNSGRSYRGLYVVVLLDFKSYAVVKCNLEVRFSGGVTERHCVPFP